MPTIGRLLPNIVISRPDLFDLLPDVLDCRTAMFGLQMATFDYPIALVICRINALDYTPNRFICTTTVFDLMRATFERRPHIGGLRLVPGVGKLRGGGFQWLEIRRGVVRALRRQECRRSLGVQAGTFWVSAKCLMVAQTRVRALRRLEERCWVMPAARRNSGGRARMWAGVASL